MPTKAYRYILLEVLVPFFGAFFFFMFVFLMFQVVRLTDYFINHGVGITLLTKMTVYISAAFLPVVLPVSFLVATLVGFGRMSADSEVVAFKASGLSLFRMYLPIGFLSLLVATALCYLTFYFIPWGNLQFKRTLVKLGNTKVVSNIKEGTFTEGFFDLLIYADKVDLKENKLAGVFLYDERDSKNPMAVMARDGVLIPLKTESELSAATILRLNAGSIYRSDISRRYYEKIDFNEYRIMLRVEEGHADEIKYAKTLGLDELRDQMRKYKGNTERYPEYAIEFWKRIALSMTPLMFAVLGVGLGVVRMRSVKSNAFFVAVGIVVAYWALHILGTNLAESNKLPAFWALQLPNIIVLPFAIESFRRSSW